MHISLGHTSLTKCKIQLFTSVSNWDGCTIILNKVIADCLVCTQTKENPIKKIKPKQILTNGPHIWHILILWELDKKLFDKTD